MKRTRILTNFDNDSCTFVHTHFNTEHQERRLSKLNSSDQNLMKPGHIVEFNNVFFKFDNRP